MGCAGCGRWLLVGTANQLRHVARTYIVHKVLIHSNTLKLSA
ncbi:hypothetical protein HMPREF3192_01293 [Atopobium deltae]|uniref:Uncharacterized protein n=1 Tax=Atopobium deltae TaxID=1393034 RepID=A0A133XPR5_9ACTN|nr:hypothetical protein HMPREF3192_01293 [Atopobium deltae]